jgi:predicted TIM-barrel fold metal-dependent hydrolase
MSDDRRFEVWDADAHVVEPVAVWESYVEPEFRDLVAQVRQRGDGTESMYAMGVDLGMSPARACIPGSYSKDSVRWADAVPGSSAASERLAVMDQEGLAHAVLFPSLYLLTGDMNDPAVAAAGCRGYNNWMSEFVLTDPNRLHGFAAGQLYDIDAAVAEIARAAELGFVGMVIRPERYGDREISGEDMLPFWAAAQDADMAVAFHGSFGTKMPNFANSRYTNRIYTHMVTHPFEQMAAVMEVMGSGILDRFPRLRVAFFESGIGWLPFWLKRLREHQETMGGHVPAFKRDPIEIWAEQCFITMEAGEVEPLAQLAELGLESTVLWGSDFPHFDCTYPGALAEFDEALSKAGLADHRDAVLNTNPRRFVNR